MEINLELSIVVFKNMGGLFWFRMKFSKAVK